MGEVIHLGPVSLSAASDIEVLPHFKPHLAGAFLRWKRYRRWTATWPVGTCELCHSPFAEGGEPGLNAGYSVEGGGPAGQDDYSWICAICFEMWRDHFDWTVLDTRGLPSSGCVLVPEPPTDNGAIQLKLLTPMR